MPAKVSILIKIFISAIGLVSITTHSQTYRRYIMHSDILTDLHHLEQLLLYHPGPLFQNNISEFKTYIHENVYPNVPDSLEMREFRNLIKEILRKTHCGHTEVSLPASFLKYFFLSRPFQIPFMAVASDSFAVIFGLHKSVLNKLHFGDTILSVNGKKIFDILTQTQKYFTYDGYIENSSRFHAQRLFYNLLPIYFHFPESYELIRYKKGKTDTLKIYAIRNIRPLTYKNFSAKDTLIKSGKKSGIYYYIPSRDSTWAYLKISAFMSNEFTKNLKIALRKTSGRKNLILDLRGNPGGKVLQAEKLYYSLFPKDTIRYIFYRNQKKSMPYNYIRHAFIYKLLHFGLRFYFRRSVQNDTVYYVRKKLRKIKIKHPFEKIYVLTNYGTFSAASFVAYRLSRQPNCEIIGTETGGTASGCNAVLSYPCRLPQTRIKIHIPAFRFCHTTQEFNDNGRGVMPHIRVENKPAYYFLKKDSVLNYTLQRIRESQKP